jgi:hypothetical protein
MKTGFRLRVLTALLAYTAFVGTAEAQCGATRSTCSACHDDARAALPRNDVWHEDHAFADLCVACHGGKGDLDDPALAHAELVAPLAAEGERCFTCHTEDQHSFVGRYQTALTDDARKPPSAGAVANGSTSPPSLPPRHASESANRALVGIIIALFVGGGAWVRRDLVRRGATFRASSTRANAGGWIRKAWSPYVAGVGLGIVVTLSMALFGHRLSGAGAYQHLSGIVGRWIAPKSIYWQHIVPTGVSWDVWVIFGSILGAFTAAKLSGQFAVRSIPEGQWTTVFGGSVARRWGIAFAGSLLTELGGGLAGGCTASLAVSGGAVLAPAAFVFMAGMFASGIPVALGIYRNASR